MCNWTYCIVRKYIVDKNESHERGKQEGIPERSYRNEAGYRAYVYAERDRYKLVSKTDRKGQKIFYLR